MSSTYVKALQFFQNSHISISNVVVTLSLVFVVSKLLKYRRDLQAVSHYPGFRVPFYPLGLPAVLLPTTWWNPGYYFLWRWRDNMYKRFGSETISLVPFLIGPPTFYTSNLDVARQVASSSGGRSFYKPETASRSILLWGMNLVAADGDVWRKHRRIMGPAFNNKLYELVWSETMKTYREMVSAEGWTDKNEIGVPAVQALTFKLALLIIGKCGFGFSFDWTEPAKTSDGKMSIQEALRIVADTHMIALFVPKWIQNLPFKKLRESREAQKELMAGSDGARRDNDAFTMLVQANEDEGGKFKLDDQELIGNVYIMLFAGHETTAHSIAATLGFLSLNPDIQEETYKHIISTVGHDRDPVRIRDYAKLDKVLAVFFEALRMFPSGHILIREAFEDTMLQIPNPPGEEGTTTIPVPKGVQVIVDMVGIRESDLLMIPDRIQPPVFRQAGGI
ncbi:cytochrome P450 [Flammula alnicola]|nr:cytochrome P450 [Flammula alnicola]